MGGRNYATQAAAHANGRRASSAYQPSMLSPPPSQSVLSKSACQGPATPRETAMVRRGISPAPSSAPPPSETRQTVVWWLLKVETASAVCPSKLTDKHFLPGILSEKKAFDLRPRRRRRCSRHVSFHSLVSASVSKSSSQI